LATALEFFNRHEAWYCKDAVNDPAQAEEVKTLVETEGGDPDTDPRMEALRLRREALTDMGALGDMIRAGREPGIISTIIRRREGGPEAAYGHSTAPALAAMEKALSGGGLPVF